MEIKKIIIAILCILFVLPVFSQSTNSRRPRGRWEVISFEPRPDTPKATVDRKKMRPTDDTYCAVVMLTIPTDNINIIEGGAVKKDSAEEKNGTWYIYVEDSGRWLKLRIDGVVYEYDLRELNHNRDIQGLQTYELKLRENRTPNKHKANATALALSIVPGLGLIQKGHVGEGVAYLAADLALIGGGIGMKMYAKNQKKIMNDRNTTFNLYQKAQKNYDAANTTSYIFYGAAAGVYILNLIRSCVAKPKRGAALQWAFVPSTDQISPLGPNLSINFALTYNF